MVAPQRARRDDEKLSVEFWPYVDSLPEEGWDGDGFSMGRVATAYLMVGDRWEHVLLDFEDANVVLVVVLRPRSVRGCTASAFST